MIPATRKTPAPRTILHHASVLVGSVSLTFGFFLVLPILQAIADKGNDDSLVRRVDSIQLPPPPPPPEPEQDKQEEEEPEPPKLDQSMPDLDLSQLEIALNPGMTGGWMSGNYGIKLASLSAGTEEQEGMFSFADLDQTPRATYQPSPRLTGPLRRKCPAQVVVLFVVDQNGRVAKVKSASPASPFSGPALAAVRRWRYEPGKRNGKPVQFRLRQTITFPKVTQP